jgi:hypothetical protein
MPKIKEIASGREIETAILPWYDPATRCWEGGNLRFSDWAGNQFTPIPDVPAPPPLQAAEELAVWRAATKVSAFQAKGALLNRGLLDEATAAATAAGGLTLLAWQTATEYDRLSPAIIALAPAIGITDPLDLDELFREAALISA